MALSAQEMSSNLIGIYKDLKARYALTREEFASLAGLKKVSKKFLREVEEALRAEGYTVIEVGDPKDYLAVLELEGLTRLKKIPKKTLAEKAVSQ